MGKAILGIDVGGSATKIVGFKNTANGRELIAPQYVHANDPLTSIYGAFGKFTMENDLSLGDIERVMMTGVGSTFAEKPLYEGLNCHVVPEFDSVGRPPEQQRRSRRSQSPDRPRNPRLRYHPRTGRPVYQD